MRVIIFGFVLTLHLRRACECGCESPPSVDCEGDEPETDKKPIKFGFTV